MIMTAELSSLLDAAYCARGNRGKCDLFGERIYKEPK